MNAWLTIAAIVVASILTLLFSILTYALRDFSRTRLADLLNRGGKATYLESTVEHTDDLIFVTAIGRLFGNILVLIGILQLFQRSGLELGWQYLLAVLATGLLTLFISVAMPHAAAQHAGEHFIAFFIRPMHGLRSILLPVVKLMHLTDALVRRAAINRDGPGDGDAREEEFEEEILSAVEEGEKEGLVDEAERRIIERVIAFHDTQVAQIMSARPEIFALDARTTLEGVKARIRESGHSRIPVFEGTLDHIIGVVYARDLMHLVGISAESFDIRKVMRPAFFVPETKPLRDLLSDFRLQKVHIAIVLDEYGGTAGLVTIEDIFEELIGDISDEHEPVEPAMFIRHGENSAEADARIYIADLNRSFGLSLPEDAGYDTLGGFISTALGKIPVSGTVFEHNGARYTILDAEPQKVNRVKIEMIPAPVVEEAAAKQ